MLETNDVEVLPTNTFLVHARVLVRDMATLFPKSLWHLTVITDQLPAKLGGQDLKTFASTSRSLLPDLTLIATQDRLGWSLSEKVRIL